MATEWKKLPHEVPKNLDRFVAMLCEAGGAPNELVLLTRYQKVVRAIADEVTFLTRQQCKHRIGQLMAQHKNRGDPCKHYDGLAQAWGLVHELPEYLAKQAEKAGTTVCVHGTPTDQICVLCP